VRAELEEAYNEEVRSAVEVKFWDHIIEKAKFKKLPESEVNAKYNEDLGEINSMYANYSSYYSSLDAFAREYLGLDSKADWKATLRSQAETAVKQKLAFYCIVRQENMIPADEEYNERYDKFFDEYLQSYLDYYKITEDSENYEAEVEEAKETIKDQFSDSYWFELIVYDYAIDKLVDNATVKNGK
jgi:FKBP-type peptidyl-prolyl cis-trans isomerase (trigger factor)